MLLYDERVRSATRWHLAIRVRAKPARRLHAAMDVGPARAGTFGREVSTLYAEKPYGTVPKMVLNP